MLQKGILSSNRGDLLRGILQGESIIYLLYMLLLIVALYVVDMLKSRSYYIQLFENSAVVRQIVYATLFICILLFSYIEDVPFIYFQF